MNLKTYIAFPICEQFPIRPQAVAQGVMDLTEAQWQALATAYYQGWRDALKVAPSGIEGGLSQLCATWGKEGLRQPIVAIEASKRMVSLLARKIYKNLGIRLAIPWELR